MALFSVPRSEPITLAPSTEAQVYVLFGLAMGVTALGVVVGSVFAGALFGTGMLILLTFLELGIILSSALWMHRSPLNMVLFLTFPLLSGITITPYLMMVIAGYANGGAILLNALGATACTALAGAVVARSGVNLQGMRGFLFFGLIGLLLFSLLQIFVPSLRGSNVDIFASGFGILLFAGFTAYDLQRIQQLGRAGANPFQLALSLYLDIYNLFLMVLRFMLAVSGNRRS